VGKINLKFIDKYRIGEAKSYLQGISIFNYSKWMIVILIEPLLLTLFSIFNFIDIITNIIQGFGVCVLKISSRVTKAANKALARSLRPLTSTQDRGFSNHIFSFEFDRDDKKRASSKPTTYNRVDQWNSPPPEASNRGYPLFENPSIGRIFISFSNAPTGTHSTHTYPMEKKPQASIQKRKHKKRHLSRKENLQPTKKKQNLVYEKRKSRGGRGSPQAKRKEEGCRRRKKKSARLNE
jgi:hypothetical protein